MHIHWSCGAAEATESDDTIMFVSDIEKLIRFVAKNSDKTYR